MYRIQVQKPYGFGNLPSDRFEDVSLNQWMALTPRDLVRDNLNAPPELLDALRKVKWPVV